MRVRAGFKPGLFLLAVTDYRLHPKLANASVVLLGLWRELIVAFAGKNRVGRYVIFLTLPDW